MSSTIYVLTYEESEILGHRIFSDYQVALKHFLSHCMDETKILLEDVIDNDKESTSSYEITGCTLEIKNIQNNEYETDVVYDYEYFNLLIDQQDDVVEFIKTLENMIGVDGVISSEILEYFSN